MNSFVLSKIQWHTILYTIVISLLLVLVGIIINQPWIGDYWEHRAVLQELINHPYNPQHPLLESNSPHAFFSPYLVALGFIGSVFHIDAAAMLDFLSIINLFLFLLSLSLLQKLVLPDYSREKGVSILLFILLFYWGINPPFYSSFMHAGAFPYTLPYPSTFAWLTSVLAAYTMYTLKDTIHRFQKILYTTTTIILVTICLLTHPLTYFFCAALIGFVSIESYQKQSNKKDSKTFRFALLVLSVPWVLAAGWPYYSFYSLLQYTHQAHQVHTDSRELYSNVYLELFPLLLIIPLLLRNPLERIKKQLALWIPITILFLLFIYGYLTHSLIIGRTLSFIAVLAQWVLIREVDSIQKKSIKQLWIILVLLCTIPFVKETIPGILQAATTTHQEYLQQPLHTTPSKNPPAVVAHHLMFLQTTLPKNKIVLADTPYLPYLPGLGAKVPAVMSPAYWIHDNELKKRLIRTFFHDPKADHAAILTRLNADYVLIPSSNSAELSERWHLIKKLPVVQKNGFTLYQIKP